MRSDMICDPPRQYIGSSLRRLHLVNSTLQQSLIQVLRITHSLEELVYELLFPDIGSKLLSTISDNIDKSLSPVQSTLQRLDFSIVLNSFDPLDDGGWNCGTMRSLVNFHRLIYLTIPSVFLLGLSAAKSKTQLADVVPPSLQRLNLTINSFDNDYWYEWTIGELVERVIMLVRGGSCGQLKAIELELPDKGPIRVLRPIPNGKFDDFDELSDDRASQARRNVAACEKLIADCHDGGITVELRQLNHDLGANGWNIFPFIYVWSL